MTPINASDWSFNPDWIPQPYIYDDTRITYEDLNFLYNGIITQPKWTSAKASDWTVS